MTAPHSVPSNLQCPEMSDYVSLSQPQLTALQSLIAGKTHTQSAQDAGVTPRTLHRWFTTDPEFLAAYNRQRAEIIAAAQSRLLSLAGAATRVIENAIAAGNVRAALFILRDMKILTPPKVGSDDPTILERESRLSTLEQLDELETREWLMQAISGGTDQYGSPLCGEVRVARELRQTGSGVIRYETHRR